MTRTRLKWPSLRRWTRRLDTGPCGSRHQYLARPSVAAAGPLLPQQRTQAALLLAKRSWLVPDRKVKHPREPPRRNQPILDPQVPQELVKVRLSGVPERRWSMGSRAAWLATSSTRRMTKRLIGLRVDRCPPFARAVRRAPAHPARVTSLRRAWLMCSKAPRRGPGTSSWRRRCKPETRASGMPSWSTRASLCGRLHGIPTKAHRLATFDSTLTSRPTQPLLALSSRTSARFVNISGRQSWSAERPAPTVISAWN
mmetsp:Transcript_4764/g.15089  ORF Transcript_4764/g.15089 Transcript_4764/m.15089 type:complete len:255 (-) Transcript_4764:2121-2885(-)